jgi:hypothetical protein
MLVLVDVNRGYKARCGYQLVLARAVAGEVLKKAVHPILQSQNVTIRIPTNYGHNLLQIG